jgi:hypothetical protein
MEPMVTFVEDNEEPVQLLIFGPEKNCVRMDTLRKCFQDRVSVGGIFMEARNDRLSRNTFEQGKTYRLTRQLAAEPAPSIDTMSFFKIQ